MTPPVKVEEPVSRFMEAVRKGDRALVASLLTRDPSLVSATDPDCFGATALIHATGREDRAMVDLLLEAGADIDQRSDWWAGSFGVLDHGSDAMARYMLERGATLTPHAAARLGRADELRAMLDADPQVVHARGGDGQLPLHFARTVEIAELLLERGADIDARDIDHESTAAQWMGGRKKTPVARHLVSRGGAVDPFLLARIGELERLKTLVADDPDGVHAQVTDERFPRSGQAAGHIYMFTLGRGCTLLHAAASGDRPEVIRWLIESGADPNARGGYDDATPLHQAAWGGCVTAAAALLDGGADIDALSGKIHRNEPVGWAIVSGTTDVVKLLLERGCRLRDAHLEDAAAGVNGEFREHNPRRPLEQWVEIARMVKRKKPPP